jgi:hypothetical protein
MNFFCLKAEITSNGVGVCKVRVNAQHRVHEGTYCLLIFFSVDSEGTEFDVDLQVQISSTKFDTQARCTSHLHIHF